MVAAIDMVNASLFYWRWRVTLPSVDKNKVFKNVHFAVDNSSMWG